MEGAIFQSNNYGNCINYGTSWCYILIDSPHLAHHQKHLRDGALTTLQHWDPSVWSAMESEARERWPSYNGCLGAHFIHFSQRLFMANEGPWRWLMMADHGWWWMMMAWWWFDDGWWCLMMVACGWWWLMMFDVQWLSVMMVNHGEYWWLHRHGLYNGQSKLMIV